MNTGATAIQIRRTEVVEEVRTLAELTGLSITDAIGQAVRNQLAIERVKADAERTRRKQAAQEALADLRRLPLVGRLITDEDLYGEDGLPR